MIVGLTGSIGTGKSTVSQMFKELGAYIIDFDILAREVVKPNRKAWKEIIKYFGREILNEDMTLDRKKLGEIVFNDQEKLARLTEITKPEIRKEADQAVADILKQDPGAIIIKDIPLLTKEIAQEMQIEKIILVYARPSSQVQRVMDRGFTRREAEQRINAQPSASEKIKYADYIIYNDGPLEETKKQVQEVYQKIRGKSGERVP
jgi:dephospho-CoA kinase